MVEPRLGLRLVRGPDWCWGDQDGGEGCVGTVVEVGEGARFVLVQWDAGTRERYRCGEDQKFDLRVFDAAPTGLHFPDIICSGCYVEGVAGIHWQCAHCYKYHLCHSCYLLGRHCQEHPFFRVESKEQAARVKVSCRADAKRVEAKGVFVGAEVVRGPHWRFGDQDGGAGKTGRVVAIEGWKTLSARSVAKVEWGTGGPTNIYRVGHKGKVDLRCTSTGSGIYYPSEHMAILGLDATVTVFDEEEIVAGDLVKVELDLEVFKMIHEAAGLWTGRLTELLNQVSLVLSILEGQRLFVTSNGDSFTICSDAVTKLKHCLVGQTVRIINDLSLLQEVHSNRDIWNKAMLTTADQIGFMTKIYLNGTVQVYVQGRGWVFDPLCLEPAPGETAHYTPDLMNEGVSLSNHTPNDIKERFIEEQLDVALLRGDLNALELFLYSNETQEEEKEGVLIYYVVMGMADAVRLCLKSGVYSTFSMSGDIIATCIIRDHTEALTTILNVGADVNSVAEEFGLRPLVLAAMFGNSSSVRAIATSPGVMIDEPEAGGVTAAYAAGKLFNHMNVAILLAAGANPTVCSDKTYECLVHETARNGSVAIMEILVVHAKGHLGLMNTKGFAPLHLAASHDHSLVCSLLAAEASVDLNVIHSREKTTPLHRAARRACWSAVECLVGWGATVNPVDNAGNTPLHNVIRSKSCRDPESSQAKQVREELSVASEGRAVEGYIAVACFLVREGADWHIKNKDGVSPRQALPPAMAVLISEYLKKHPEPGTFHGSLCRQQQQRKLQELPIQLELALPHSSSASDAAASATATDDASSKASKNKDYVSFGPEATKPGIKSGLLPKAYKDASATEKLLAGKPPLVTGQQSQASGDQLTSSPSRHLPPEGTAVQPSGVLRQPCLLCEDHPASIRFSPCGHIVMCSECAQRATKCLQCKAYVESKSTDNECII